MSYRPQFSYWLTVHIPHDMSNMPGLASTVIRQVREATDDDIHDADLADLPLSFSMRVADSNGTVEEISDIEAIMCRISNEHRRLSFDLTAINEDDKSEQHAWWFMDGKVMCHNMARLIDADDDEMLGLASLSRTQDRTVFLLKRMFNYLRRESDDPVRDMSALIGKLMTEASCPDDPGEDPA